MAKHVLLLREWVWSRFDQGILYELILIINCYSFYKHEGHALTYYPLIEKKIHDVMINHFQTKVQIKWNLEEEHNLMIMWWNVAKLVQP